MHAMNSNDKHAQRRKNDRFPLRAHATLESGNGDWPAHVINLSIDGAMIAIAEEHSIQTDDEVELTVYLDDEQRLLLQGQVVHIKDHFIGLKCKVQTSENEGLLTQLIGKISHDDD